MSFVMSAAALPGAMLPILLDDLHEAEAEHKRAQAAAQKYAQDPRTMWRAHDAAEMVRFLRREAMGEIQRRRG